MEVGGQGLCFSLLGSWTPMRLWPAYSSFLLKTEWIQCTPAVNQLSSLCLQRTQLEHNPPSPPPLHPPQYPPLNPQLPRHIKLNFPRFNGGEPTEWLTKIKQYSAYRGVPRVQQVSFVSYHLTEEANEWWFATSKVLGTDPNNSPW